MTRRSRRPGCRLLWAACGLAVGVLIGHVGRPSARRRRTASVGALPDRRLRAGRGGVSSTASAAASSSSTRRRWWKHVFLECIDELGGIGGAGPGSSSSTTSSSGATSSSSSSTTSGSSGTGGSGGTNVACWALEPGLCRCEPAQPSPNNVPCGPSVVPSAYCCMADVWPEAGSTCACNTSTGCSVAPAPCQCGADAGVAASCTGTTCSCSRGPGRTSRLRVLGVLLPVHVARADSVQVPSCVFAELGCGPGYHQVTTCR